MNASDLRLVTLVFFRESNNLNFQSLRFAQKIDETDFSRYHEPQSMIAEINRFGFNPAMLWPAIMALALSTRLDADARCEKTKNSGFPCYGAADSLRYATDFVRATTKRRSIGGGEPLAASPNHSRRIFVDSVFA